MTDPLVVVAIGALLGLALGMLGGGGGVLAVPLLVATGEPVIVASTMSLVVVGTASAAALVPHHRAGRVDWEVGLTFGLVGAAGAVVGARLAQVTSPEVVLSGMAVMLLLGAAAMLRAARRARGATRAGTRRAARLVAPDGTPVSQDAPEIELVAGEALVEPDLVPLPAAAPRPRTRMVALGSGVGLVTGFFGVGAGFVVVPALVAAMRLPIRRATATALVVIVLNSAVALAVRHSHLAAPALTAGLAATTGVFAVLGAKVSQRVPAWVLSAVFGSLMLVVAAYTATQALPG